MFQKKFKVLVFFIKHHTVKHTLPCDEISKLNNNKMDATHSVSISGHQITFQFQLGLVRDRVTVDSNELNLNSLKVSNSNIYKCTSIQSLINTFKLYLNYNFVYLTLKTFQAMAVTFVNEKFPAHGITRISERIIMYRHDYSSANILQVRKICAMPSYIKTHKELLCWLSRSFRIGSFEFETEKLIFISCA